MLKRYVGPYDEVSVFVAGAEYGNVAKGDSIAVPDDVANSVEWSEHWEDVKSTKAAEKKRAKEEEKAREAAVSEPVTPDEDYNDQAGTPESVNEDSKDDA